MTSQHRSPWRPVLHGRAAELRWLTRRSWTNRWYPQGVDTGLLQGRRMLAISWFRQDAQRHHLAARVTFVDADRPRPLDVALAVLGPDGALEPARIHAGGLAWFDDRLFAAATGQGIWEFDLTGIRSVRGDAARRLTAGERSQALAVPRTRVHPVALRCSFIGRVFDERAAALPRVLIGEFRADGDGRIGEFDLDGFAAREVVATGIRQMQGAVRWGGTTFVSQSDATRPGTLWAGAVDALERTAIPLPAGCQDLALDLERRVLWTLGEHPWRRVVRGIPLDRLGLQGA
ncbi:hypothetical protein [Microbacterium sp.]|uniref:hypothetical protein n=1 Tax=Microbacterium sp. TaxID=51671 RepID=UPI0039E6719A